MLGQANLENALHYAPIAAEAQVLLSPNEMGELFKVLAVGRGVKPPLLGFSRGDRSIGFWRMRALSAALIPDLPCARR